VRKILIVTHDTPHATAVVSSLRESGCEFTVTSTFTAARDHLDAADTRPSLVVVEVRLGAYNGLQLALHARARGIPAIVIGEPNPITEYEARELGAAYLSWSDLGDTELQSVAAALTDAHRPSDGGSSEDPLMRAAAMPFAAAWALASASPVARAGSPTRFLVH
jgi:DNA-binding response OmpR family regulator